TSRIYIASATRADERVFHFFFQAEDGIRDATVTGVQTCALPICHRGNRGVNVNDSRGDHNLAVTHGTLLGIADHALQAGNRQPLADSGATVDALILARQEGNLLDHLADVAGYLQPPLAVAAGPGLLRSYGQAFLHRRWVMRGNVRTDTIFQRGDDLAEIGRAHV